MVNWDPTFCPTWPWTGTNIASVQRVLSSALGHGPPNETSRRDLLPRTEAYGEWERRAKWERDEKIELYSEAEEEKKKAPRHHNS